jgi:hypothetical protein
MKLPRVRFTVRMTMVAVVVLAAAFAAWMEVDRYQWRRWRQHLNTEMTWVQSPVDEFYAKDDAEDPFKKVTANSLLKISSPGVPDREGYYDRYRWWLGRRGELETDRVTATRFGGKGGGGQHILTAAQLAQVQQIISALPPPTATSWQGDLLLVATLSEGSWVTKVYDKAALPPAIQDLVRVLQPGSAAPPLRPRRPAAGSSTPSAPSC